MNDVVTGVDRRDRGVFVAVTGTESGRTTIQSLGRESLASAKAAGWKDSKIVTLGIPETQAIVKSIRIEVGDEATREDRLRFEMASSLLESEDEFLFTAMATGDDERYLGMMLRRDMAARICDALGGNFKTDADLMSFQARAVGLGRGYLTFGAQAGSDLICLTDLTDEVASICLVHDRQIVDIASLAIEGRNLTSAVGQEQFAIELKTLVNYRLATLLDAGISVPLAGLLMAGDKVDDSFRQIVQTYFPVGVRPPRLHEGFLAGIEIEERELLPLFLVALGLSVN